MNDHNTLSFVNDDDAKRVALEQAGYIQNRFVAELWTGYTESDKCFLTYMNVFYSFLIDQTLDVPYETRKILVKQSVDYLDARIRRFNTKKKENINPETSQEAFDAVSPASLSKYIGACLRVYQHISADTRVMEIIEESMNDDPVVYESNKTSSKKRAAAL